MFQTYHISVGLDLNTILTACCHRLILDSELFIVSSTAIMAQVRQHVATLITGCCLRTVMQGSPLRLRELDSHHLLGPNTSSCLRLAAWFQ